MHASRNSPGVAGSPWLRLVVTAVGMAGLLLLISARYRVPEPAPPTAPANAFAATRAFSALRTILGDESPHPVGSRANTLVRGRIVQELERMGYQPRIETGDACSRWGRCETVVNVLARLEGTRGGKAVLVSTHYDSVPAGPGAADDGAGVAAALEIARILKRAPLPRPVLFLFNDGEEAGLLGATAFVEQDPAREDVGVVVNLEARGTSGPSLMFETNQANAGVVARFARAVRRPVTSSAFYAVYSAMPNDTDLTVYKEAGLPGLNFAFIGSAQNYHTAHDSLEHLDLGSLQHQGDNALEVIRELGQPPEVPTDDDAVFFDVLAWQTIWWPTGWALPLALFALVLVAGAAMRLRRRLELSVADIVRGTTGWLVSISIAVLIATALASVWGRSPAFVERPGMAIATLWCAGGFGCAVARWLWWRASVGGLMVGQWWVWAVLQVVLAATWPELSFPFFVPSLVAGAVGLVWSMRPITAADAGWEWFVLVAPATASALFFFQHGLLLYDALGLALPEAIAVVAALALTPLVPLLGLGPRRPSAVPVGALLLVAATGTASLLV